MTNRIANLGVSNNPYQTKGSSATTGVESGTELNIDDIINKLKNGDTSVLELFKNFSLNYAMEFTDTGYVVKFTYQGIKYEITYINTENNSTESSNEETATKESSVAQPPTTQPPVTNPQTEGVTPPTETDPHYPQGYTKEEIVNYLIELCDGKESWAKEMFEKTSYYTEGKGKYGEILYVGHKLYEMFFVEKDGMYYFRSDFEFAGKKYDSLDDLEYFYKEQYVGGELRKGLNSPVIVTEAELKNCGYNFLPEEIDIYFDKNKDGTYSIKRPAVIQVNHIKGCAFHSLKDLVTYLKGGKTAGQFMVLVEDKWVFASSDTGFNEKKPAVGLAEGVFDKESIDKYINERYKFDSSRFTGYVMQDLLKQCFKETQSGHYVINQEFVKKLFPDKEIKTFEELLAALETLDEMKPDPENAVSPLDNHNIEKPTVTDITEETAIKLGYTIVKTPEDLLAMANNPNGKYILMCDIDMSGIEWTPIGSMKTPFTGQLNGNGYTIKNLTIKSDSVFVGLFGVTDGAEIYNLKIDNANVISTNNSYTENSTETSAGILVGYAKNTILDTIDINNSHVEGKGSAGLLAGKFDGGTICHINAEYPSTCKGGYKVGGIVGNIVRIDEGNNIESGVTVYGGVYQGILFGAVDYGRIVDSDKDFVMDGEWYGPEVIERIKNALNPDENTIASGELVGLLGNGSIVSRKTEFDINYYHNRNKEMYWYYEGSVGMFYDPPKIEEEPVVTTQEPNNESEPIEGTSATTKATDVPTEPETVEITDVVVTNAETTVLRDKKAKQANLHSVSGELGLFISLPNSMNDKTEYYIWNPFENKFELVDSSIVKDLNLKNYQQEKVKYYAALLAAQRQGLNYTIDPYTCKDDEGNIYKFDLENGVFVKVN